MTSGSGGGLLTDAPIVSEADDRFGRGPWAARVATTIAAQRDPASVVIGIYAPWGAGKTSALNLIESALAAAEGVVPVRFNPWRLGDETEMFHGFFATLAEALDAKLATKSEQVGEVLRKYGALLKPIPFAGDAASGTAAAIGAALSEASLGRLRERIESLLRGSGQRVVILMDDLDRLDKSEIQSMFRLVKVAADFAHSAYVLAFDHAVVADALAERYSGGAQHGVSFMDKIIQLPLHLPPAPREELRRLTLEAVDEALTEAGIELAKNEAAEFVSAFDRTIGPMLHTPRAGKRYGNAMLFALPMKNEVRPVDLMLVESMRICYPPLYEWVRANEERVIAGPSDDEAKARLQTAFDGVTSNLDTTDRARAQQLLSALFPRMGSVWENRRWGSEWDDKWTEQRRITSKLYFRRYFTYSVAPGEVSDADLDALLEMVSDPSTESAELSQLEATVFGSPDLGAVLQKLAARIITLDAEGAARFALLISAAADVFSHESGFLGLSQMERAALLVRDLIGRVSSDDRGELVDELMRSSPHLPFATTLIQWLRPQDDDGPAPVIGMDDCIRAGGLLAERALEAWRRPGAFASLNGAVAASLHVIGLYGDRDTLVTLLSEKVRADRQVALDLLRAFLGRSWAMDTGMPLAAEFRRAGYDAVVEYVDAQAIFEVFQGWLGTDVGTGDKYSFRELPEDQRLAHEFAHVHRAVVQGQPDAE